MNAKPDQATHPCEAAEADRQRELLRRKLLELIKRNEQLRRKKAK